MTRWVDGVAIVVWNCFAWLIWGLALVEVARAPAGRFAHGWRAKLGRLAVIVAFSGVVGGVYLPVGAIVVLAAMRRTRDRGPTLPATSTPAARLPRHPGGFAPFEDR